ncbi:hypothetical protein V501_01820 [Pseudogymnoascus sp. VKM F-4519 (FW-2642)]|nr:hypothetical protein V501_01820 [Pseudogymnoascus sp. VKM F-4519 (FW-2642)]
MRNNVAENAVSDDDLHVQESNTGSGKGHKGGPEDDGPACQPCRKKKARCSRKQPCSHCVRFNVDCVYDDRKMKPGLRTGVVEKLNQRVATLENMFLGQGVLWQQVWNCLNSIQAQTPTSLDSATNAGETLKVYTSRLKSTLSHLSADFDPSDGSITSPLKRRRAYSTGEEEQQQRPQPAPQSMLEDKEYCLPPDDLIDALVDIYFRSIHPWIPILHVKQFRERMANPAQRQKLTTIFHAIVSLCIRFSNDPRVSSAEVRMKYSTKSRQIVILQSMESFSVENLQALVICAFDTIGSGRGPSAWSIVGSMTRTVEQLQLSVEEEDQSQSAEEFLIKRMAFLPPCNSWIEREERRRVFWNVFLMDRFCSIATGWNFSLTSADAKRRLPCEGALWEEGRPLKSPTPYFGVADKTAGGALPSWRPELEDQRLIGGFAYCIEASESLSLVTTFFLRQAVNMSNDQDVQMWLMRFKELDLRLVQWKLFLPEKWREACALNADGVLDPNLTLAHITHNTAVGLLHQGIAYPSPEWQARSIRLPSTSSAETCLAAAMEVSIIAEKYLQDSISLTNPQFAFCLFISGRMLLAHTLHYNIPLPQEFDSLTNSLREISRRWNGPHAQDGLYDVSQNLASKFASRLVHARDRGPHALDIRQAAYSEDNLQNSSAQQTAFVSQIPQPQPSHTNPNGTLPNNSISHLTLPIGQQLVSDGTIITDQEGSPDSISLAFPPLPLAFQPHCANPSPGMSNMQQLSEFFDSAEKQGQGSMEGYGEEGMGYEFEYQNPLTYSFLPTQRVSMFSGQNGKEGEGEE